MNKIHELLRNEAFKRNSKDELSSERLDPLLIASKYNDEYISLICALFAYGNVKSIVKLLNSFDFSVLDKDTYEIEKKLENHYYRFQSNQDIIEFFKTMRFFKQNASVESMFLEGYLKNSYIIDGLQSIISYMYDLNSYRSRGYEFLLGQIPTIKSTSPYKRWNMYLRWMVREDNLDLGLWKSVNKKDLLIPLDTHTFNIGSKLGLIQRKSCDFKAVLELTNALKKIDINDPIKYDFALYRIGQEKLL